MRSEIKEAIIDSVDYLRRDRRSDPAMYARLFPTLGDLLHTARCRIDDVRDELKPVVEVVEGPASFEDLRSMLSVAARRRGHVGATDAQINMLARLAVRDGLALRQMDCSVLTRGEATNIISTFN